MDLVIVEWGPDFCKLANQQLACWRCELVLVIVFSASCMYPP